MGDHGAEEMLHRLDGGGNVVDSFPIRAARLTIVDPAGAEWCEAEYDLAPVLDVVRGGELTMTLDPATVPDLLALFCCHLDDHQCDGTSCVPSWIPLGEN